MIKKVLFILMPKDFQDFEFQIPYKVLNEQGFVVDVAGLQPGTALGMAGSKFTPNLQLDALTEKDFNTYSALIIPGGPGSTTYLWGNKKVQSVAWYFNDNKKIVAAICNACAVPVEADLLKGKKGTIFPTPEGKALFAQHGAKFVEQGCVINKEDKIITAQSPEFIKEFAQAIVTLLKEQQHS